VPKLLFSSRLGVMEDAGKIVRTCRINRVVFGNYSKLTDVLNFTNHENFQKLITRLAALRTFYQRPYINRSHNQ